MMQIRAKPRDRAGLGRPWPGRAASRVLKPEGIHAASGAVSSRCSGLFALLSTELSPPHSEHPVLPLA